MIHNDINTWATAIKKSQIFYAGLLALFVGVSTGDESFAEEFRAGHYDIKSTTVMPHLDEMRRNIKQEQICVPKLDVIYLFPVLQNAAFTGCRARKLPSDDGERYDLDCPGPNGAAGSMTIKAHQQILRGQLETKMGGKNMTFSQFIEAKRMGPCPQ